MSVMRAKMKVASVTKNPTSESLRFVAVSKSVAYEADGLDEDNSYATWTPMANLDMTITNPVLMNKFEAGQTFYVDFSPAR